MSSPHGALLARVQKLLALASSQNVHEAASAAAMAQALIERHRLDVWLAAAEDVAHDPIEEGLDSPLEVAGSGEPAAVPRPGRRARPAKKLRKWKVVLAAALAEANGCIATIRRMGDGEAIVLVGRAADRAAVAELWAWLVKRIEWLSATHGAGRDREWHESFRVGAASAVGEHLAAVSPGVRGEQEPAALVRLDPVAAARRQALDDYVAQHLRLGPGRGVRVQPEAWRRGRAAAAELV